MMDRQDRLTSVVSHAALTEAMAILHNPQSQTNLAQNLLLAPG